MVHAKLPLTGCPPPPPPLFLAGPPQLSWLHSPMRASLPPPPPFFLNALLSPNIMHSIECQGGPCRYFPSPSWPASPQCCRVLNLCSLLRQAHRTSWPPCLALIPPLHPTPTPLSFFPIPPIYPHPPLLPGGNILPNSNSSYDSVLSNGRMETVPGGGAGAAACRSWHCHSVALGCRGLPPWL